MRGSSVEISAAFARLRSRALGTTALTILAVTAAPAAWAQTVTPTANSLPGSFFTNNGAGTVTYKQGDTVNQAVIDTGGTAAKTGDVVLQWGGSKTTNVTATVDAPNGITTTNGLGFSIGAGATLSITGQAHSVLVSDQTANPSQIFGTLDAHALGSPLAVANQNGVIVGSAGVINAPTGGCGCSTYGGIGLLGYKVDPETFLTNQGSITIDSSTLGAGVITVPASATITGHLLVATNGTVNIGTVATGGNGTSVAAGYGGTFLPDGGYLQPTGPLGDGKSSVVNITPAANGARLSFAAILAGGAVNNSANLNVPRYLRVAGVFTNDGVLNDNARLEGDTRFGESTPVPELAGGLVNNGVLNEVSRHRGLHIVSDGNIQNKGVLNLAGSHSLILIGENVDLEGSVTIGGKPLSSTNALNNLEIIATGAATNFTDITEFEGVDFEPLSLSAGGGVADIATSLFTRGEAIVVGNAIRVLSGGITSAGDILLLPGTNASAVSDPFYNLPSLQYTFSMFPGTQISGTTPQSAPGDLGLEGSVILIANPDVITGKGDTSYSTSPGLNLDGQLSAPAIIAFANNINSNNGLNGGFVVPDGGTLLLLFYGNINNPAGAAENGSSSFLYNYVPVTVGSSGGKAGTANIFLAGPGYSNATEQNVNLLVNGNANLGNIPLTSAFLGESVDGFSIPNLTPPPTPTAALSSYANNHLVVTATGNIGFYACSCDSSQPASFYWPGLVYLTSGATASNPTAAPNATASISLVNANTDTESGGGGSVNLNNLIPADLTKPSVGGQTGHGGIFFETNNLNLAGATVTTSNDSWVNFLTPALASAFQTTLNANFFGGVISGDVVNTQKLPAGDFQPQ